MVNKKIQVQLWLLLLFLLYGLHFGLIFYYNM